ncbi:hypothetical protein HUU05_04835 [candidate division KSB1 bacterium]|nr:hypothetical protein [candidate division KSB1 bacterium]
MRDFAGLLTSSFQQPMHAVITHRGEIRTVIAWRGFIVPSEYSIAKPNSSGSLLKALTGSVRSTNFANAFRKNILQKAIQK